jgi:hypothetical protein
MLPLGGATTIREIDLGLGTTYERFAIYRWLERLIDRHPIRDVLEGPGDGVAGISGINSVPLARRGAKVTVALRDRREIALARRVWEAQDCLAQGSFVCANGLPLPFTSRRFDLVWNFNRLPFFNPQAMIAEMARISRRYVLLMAPSRHNYGFLARRVHHRLTGRPWHYGDIDVMEPGKVIDLLAQFELQALEAVLLDAPWWPDIIDLSEFVTDLLPFLSGRLKGKRPSSYRWEPDNLPYFDARVYPEVHRRIDRLSFIEGSRAHWIKRFFAHHFGVLAVKREAIDD